MKKTLGIAAVVGALTLTLTACGGRGDDTSATDRRTDSTSSDSGSPSAPATSAAPIDYKACMVSDSGGFDDKSFNQTALQGQTDAVTQYGVQTAKVQSNSDSEYVDNINSLLKAKCNEITTVGFKLGDATLAAAKANPKVDFAIVDYAYDKGQAPNNLKGLVYDTESPSYLAGYIAAASSKSGIVGTFGGLPIPTVTSYMEGFRLGIERYNTDNSANVKLLGWDGKKGSFTQDFEDASKGQQLAEQQIQQGADVIFPVAGNAGTGGLQAAQDGDAKAIWVDTDGCESVAQYCDLLLTSVEKGLDVSVTQAIGDAVDGKFTNKLYDGTLANGGVGLAPLSSDVPSDVASKVDELKQGLIDGSIKLTS